MKKTGKSNQHYVAVDGLGWSVHEDQQTAVLNRILDSKSVYTINVFSVPLPIHAPYDFDNHTPQVEGAVMVASIRRVSMREPVKLTDS